MMHRKPAFLAPLPLQASKPVWAITSHPRQPQLSTRTNPRASAPIGPSETTAATNKSVPATTQRKKPQGFGSPKQSHSPTSQKKNPPNQPFLPKDGKKKKVQYRDIFREGISLRELVLGAEMKGIVQNLVRHGAYVDVGAVTDGLVHVRDMAVEFVHSPKDLVRSGDTVTVWVKYVNPVTNILGLTMIKPTLGFRDRIEVSQIKIGKRYHGHVERITNYGAYVDIGAERLGFLHIAAIWGQRPRDTLDNLRLGQTIWVNVDDVDEIRSHIKLRARGKNDKQLTEHGPLGELASSPDVAPEDGIVRKSQILHQRVLLQPGDEEFYERKDEEEEEVIEEESDDYDVDDEFSEYNLDTEDITRPGFFVTEDDVVQMIDENFEFTDSDGRKITKEDMM